MAQVLTHFENDPQISASAAKNVLGSLSALLEPFIDMPAQQEPVFYLQVPEREGERGREGEGEKNRERGTERDKERRSLPFTVTSITVDLRIPFGRQ